MANNCSLESTSRVQFAIPDGERVSSREERGVKRPEKGRGKGWERERGRKGEKRRAAAGGGRARGTLSRHSPHAILHTPLSVLYSTLLHYAGTAYKRRYPPLHPSSSTRRESPYVHQVLTRRPLSRLCATAINTSAHCARLVIEWEKYGTYFTQ